MHWIVTTNYGETFRVFHKKLILATTAWSSLEYNYSPLKVKLVHHSIVHLVTWSEMSGQRKRLNGRARSWSSGSVATPACFKFHVKVLPFVFVVVDDVRQLSESPSPGEQAEASKALHWSCALFSNTFIGDTGYTRSVSVMEKPCFSFKALSITLNFSNLNCFKKPLNDNCLAWAKCNTSLGPPP